MASVYGVLASKMPFFLKNVPQKNAPMPSLSRIGPNQYGHPKDVPKKQKVKLLALVCLFLKRKFN